MDNSDEDVIVTSVQSAGIRKDVLEDLCSRFLINIPQEEKNDMVRICFQIELAHWFYLDFYRQEDPMLPGYGVQQFMELMFNEFPFLNKANTSIQEVHSKWKRYKLEVPVFGAIMLDESLENTSSPQGNYSISVARQSQHCILVRGFHKRVSWGFPKGKVNKDEEDVKCAIREVKEETGFDLSDYIDENEYLERNFHDHRVRLYIAPAVPLNHDFEPKTRGEIKEIKWFAIDSLPTHKKDTTPKDRLNLNASQFFMVQPFVKDLRKWVNQKKHSIEQIRQFSNSLSMPVIGSTYSAFTPVLNEPLKQQMLESAKEEEDRLRRRKEEEQKRFQEIQLLQHPLREDHSVNEKRLRSLLGVSPQTAKERKQSPQKPPDRGTKNQPEAIRRLLAGTVDISPVNSPERPITKGGFGVPPGYLDDRKQAEKRSSPKDPYLVQKGRNQKGKKSYPLTPDRHTDDDSPVNSVLAGKGPGHRSKENGLYSNIVKNVGRAENLYSQDVQSDSKRISKGWLENPIIRAGLSSNHNGLGKVTHPTENLDDLEMEQNLFPSLGKKSDVGCSILDDKKKGKRKVELGEKWPEFHYDIPEFVNFKFNKEKLMATLPQKTIL